MLKLYKLAGLLTALLLSPYVHADDIQVEDAWSRATAPGQNAASVDMSITSKLPAILLGVSSTAAKGVAMHSMRHQNGVMKMREVLAIELPAAKRFNLGANGYHLMLTGLNAPLKAGDNVELTLTIKLANQRTVKVKATAAVKSLTESKAEHQQEHSHQ